MLRKGIFFPTVFALILGVVPISRARVAPQYDLLIRGGTVIDGTGKPGFIADVGITGDKIAFVGNAGNATAKEMIDAKGLVVAPGFIDVHNHTAPDITEPAKKLNEGFVRQGVTTIVGGPDGEFAPDEIQKMLDAYKQNGIGTNVAFYIGHNGIRQEVMGSAHRLATPEEIEKMKAMVKQGMEMGCLGLSTGLMYEPGMFSNTDEVVELAKVVKPFQGIYDSHTRDPGRRFVETDVECIEIGRRAGIPAKIAHEKCVGLENEGKMKVVIGIVDKARAKGENVVADQYPYDGAATSTLSEIIVVPDSMKSGGGFDLKAALRDPEKRKILKQTSENGINGGFAWLKATGYSMMRITSSKDYPDKVGKYLSELADEKHEDPFDAISEMEINAKHPVRLTLGAVKEYEVRELMVQPWVMISSDGEYMDSHSPAVGHPRSSGSFPRVLGHYSRDLKLLSLQEAVRKMTSFSADFLGLNDRGRIAVGKAADITVFDPKTINDRSTWDEPQLMSVGVIDVVVNGAPVLSNGELTGKAPGKYIKRQR